MRCIAFFLAILLGFLVTSESLSFKLTRFDHGDSVSRSGDATFQPTCSCIQLTTDQFAYQPVNSSGRIIYNYPARLRDDKSPNGVVSFNTSFTFKIEQILEPNQSAGFRPGAGLGFMLVPAENKKVPTDGYGEYIGLLNRSMQANSTSHLLAVEFDNVLNPEFNDPSNNHIGVDVNNMVSISTYNLTEDLRLDKNYTLTAWIEYKNEEDALEVRLSNTDNRPQNYSLRTVFFEHGVKLSDVLTEEMYVGFSAATGQDCFQFHTIHSWEFSSVNSEEGCSGFSCPRVLVPVVVCIGVVLFLAAAVLIYLRRSRNRKYQEEFRTLPADVSVTRFSYKELRSGSKGFGKKQLLGVGGFSKVYKGKMKDGSPVAVKYLERERAKLAGGSDSSWQQFVAEISVIGRLRHRNLVGLRGFCYERGKLLLVYEYMPNLSLDKALFDNGTATLNWEQRYSIIKGVAEALAFLHEGWEQKVVHRDVKAANVLLDDKLNAKLGDFGFSRLTEHDAGTQVWTAVGTRGYIAPELLNEKATEKSDVYSFGILVLEVISGRRATQRLENDLLLYDWTWVLTEQKRETQAADIKLLGAFPDKEFIRAVHLALLCSHPDPNRRPTMKNCCRLLEEEGPLSELPAFKPVQMYTSSLSSIDFFSSSAYSSSDTSGGNGYKAVEIFDSTGRTN